MDWARRPISLGFICGLALLAFGNLCHRRNLRGLDVGFVSVGLGTLYLSSYSAAQVHHLLPGSMALVLIFVTTAVGASLAHLWTSQGLAILTFFGGYLAPLFFTCGSIDSWLFLGYLLILTLGSQILAYAQDWRHLYSGGAALTWLSLAVWSHRDYRKELFQETFLFTQILFAAYSLMPFLRAVSKKGTKGRLPVSGCQRTTLQLVFSVPPGLPKVARCHRQPELRDCNAGGCPAVMAPARSRFIFELAHRTSRGLSSPLLGSDLE